MTDEFELDKGVIVTVKVRVVVIVVVGNSDCMSNSASHPKTECGDVVTQVCKDPIGKRVEVL